VSLSRDSRQERKLKALMRAQRRLKTKLDDIDWEEDVLTPMIAAVKSGKSVLGLPDGMAFDIVIEHENTDQAKADANVSDTLRRDTSSSDGD
jgi:hypothetical protein